MQTMKRVYSGVMHSVTRTGSFAWLEQLGRHSDPYGWRRWAASLLAIHDVEKMIDLDLPWWNVAATREVEHYLAARPGARVFEYGAGASTAWLARRASEVVSVEHHAEWHSVISPLLDGLPHARLWRRDLEGVSYVSAIEEAGGQFDLVVIDGRRRIECLNHAVPFLRRGGIILFDDTGRSRYRSGIEGSGLRHRRHFGRSYCVPYPDYSTILYG